MHDRQGPRHSGGSRINACLSVTSSDDSHMMIMSTSLTCYLLGAAVLAAAPGLTPQHDPFEAAREVFRFSFENNEDRDFDQQPDDWQRRRGPGFPAYVEAVIDRNRGAEGRQSLRINLNGGQAAMYSPIRGAIGRIDAHHSYVFRGRIRSERLEHSAAVLSVSLLNTRRQRVQRFLSRPVTGTHGDWVELRIGPITPDPEVQFVIIGCHLVRGEKIDIGGAVWFDDLWLGRLPRLKLETNFYTQFLRDSAPIEVTSHVSGLAPRRNWKLTMRLRDVGGNEIASREFPLRTPPDPHADPPPPALPMPAEASSEDGPGGSGSSNLPASAAVVSSGTAGTPFDGEQETQTSVWSLPPQPHGFYYVDSELHDDRHAIVVRRTSFAVMELDDVNGTGPFGWTITGPHRDLPQEQLSDIAAQAGINWLKYPVWEEPTPAGAARSAGTSRLFDRLAARHIAPVGLLNRPPGDLRRQFAANWDGVSEVFSMPAAFWSKSLDAVLARHSASVRHWQLGGDDDGSFIGLTGLDATLKKVVDSFHRIDRKTRVGIPWDWTTSIPDELGPQSFVALRSDPPLDARQLQESLASGDHRAARWVVLKPREESATDATQAAAEAIGSDLIRRMVAARRGGAEAIFITDVLDPQTGLLNPDGSPRALFLPWRTAARTLGDAKYLGTFELPGGSSNAAFVDGGELVTVMWNDRPTREDFHLGEQVNATDMWGRTSSVPVDERTGRQQIDVGPSPIFLRGGSLAVARWRIGTRWSRGRVPSAYGTHTDEVTFVNTFPAPAAVALNVQLPGEWEVDYSVAERTFAPGEAVTVPVRMNLPRDAGLGTRKSYLEFEVAADRPYRFRVHRPYRVGLGDIDIRAIDRRLPDGRLEIEQIITNNTSPTETLDFRCSLFVPGAIRQKRLVQQLGSGETRRFYYLDDAARWKGRELLLRAEEVDGARVLNFRWKVGASAGASTADASPDSSASP